MSRQQNLEAYQRALIRANQAYDNVEDGQGNRARASRAHWGEANMRMIEARNRLPENIRRQQINNNDEQLLDLNEVVMRGAGGAGDAPIHVLRPQEVNGENGPALRAMQARMIARNNGSEESMQLRPFNPEQGQMQTRTVVVKVKGYYEVMHGDVRVVGERNHEKNHVFTIKNFTSHEELLGGVRTAFNRFSAMIEHLDGDSGYKAFYPMIWIANDGYEEQELAQFVRTPTTIRLHARVPVMYGFLNKMGIDTDAIPKDKAENKLVNCLSGALLKHMQDHKIMVRHKWTELKIARAALELQKDDEMDNDDVTKRGLTIGEAQAFMDSHKMFNAYCFDQYSNLIWKSEYAEKGVHMPNPFMCVSHDAHCYTISDEDVKYKLLQRIRAAAASKESSNIFLADKEVAKQKQIQSVVELLQRPRFEFVWDSSESLDLEKLDTFKDCNLFMKTKCLHSLLIELLRKQNYVHTGQYSNGRFVRLNYHNNVTIWANPNSSVNNPGIGLFGSSAMTKVVAKKFAVDFKNQSIGAATTEFCDTYHNPLGGKNGGRPIMTKKDRLRHLNRFKSVCQICMKKIGEKEAYDIDHIIRREVGGRDTDDNLQVLHRTCHDKKSAMECNIFKLDRTLSHFNSATLPIFSEAKNALVHNYIPYTEYAEIIINENKKTGKKSKSLLLHEGVILAGLDIVKCRTNILRYGIKDEFCDFSALSDPEPFNYKKEEHKNIPAGEYWIQTKIIGPTKGNGWYSHITVKHLLAHKMIGLDQIKWVIISLLNHPGNYYAPFVQAVLDKIVVSEEGTYEWKQEVHVAKNCINQWVGTLGIRSADFKSTAVYSSLEAAATDSSERRAGICSKESAKKNDFLKAGETVKLYPKVFDNKDQKNYTKDGALIRHDYIETVTTSSKLKSESHVPIYRCILDAEACELHLIMMLLKKHGGKVVNVNTDNAVAMFDNQKQVDAMWAEAQTIFWDDEKKVAKYKRGDIPSVNVVERMEERSKTIYNYTIPEYKITPDPGHDDFKAVAKKMVADLLNPDIDGSTQIDAVAGTGKTTLTQHIINRLEKLQVPYLAVAPTHVASLLLGEEGSTLDSALSACKHGNYKALGGYKVIILDEKSMCKELFWNALLMLKKHCNTRFIIVGCWLQLLPVKDRSADFNYEDSAAIHEICGGNMLHLTKCRRSKDDKGGRALFDQYVNVAEMDIRKFAAEVYDLSIAATNSVVHAQNRICMAKHKPSRFLEVKASERMIRLKNCQDITLYDNLPLMSCTTKENIKLYNSERWIVKSWNHNEVTLKKAADHECELKVDTADLADWFRPAYCVTAHKVQGLTIREPYTIYQFNKMSDRMRYVVLSRGTTISDVNIYRKKHVMEGEGPDLNDGMVLRKTSDFIKTELCENASKIVIKKD